MTFSINCGDFMLNCARSLALKLENSYGELHAYVAPAGKYPLQEIYERIKVANSQSVRWVELEGDLKRLNPFLQVEVKDRIWQKLSQNLTEDIDNEEEVTLSKEDVLLSIQECVEGRINGLGLSRLSKVAEEIWKISGRPMIDDYGMIYMKADATRLIRALHREGLLDEGKIVHYRNTEVNRPYYSRIYELDGYPNLKRGRIGYINGMKTTFEGAHFVAKALSDQCAGSVNFHSVHTETYGSKNDLIGAALGHRGIPGKGVRLLHEVWQTFFEESSADERFLQICHSRGCIDTYNALELLPKSLRDRIVVLSLGPAHIIPSDLCYQAVNAVILSDEIIWYSPNKHLIGKSPDVTILPKQKEHPHNVLGSSYIEFAKRQITYFLEHHCLEPYEKLK